ncbi:MAG TPA: hypothetical protein VIG93_05445 [Gaiellaceae bacterium]
MEWWLVLLALLVCPLVMGGMMLVMMRGMRGGHGSGSDGPEGPE